MKQRLFSLLLCMAALAAGQTTARAASPIAGLLERIDKGASRKFIIEKVKSDTDFFELDQKGDKVVVRGNSYVTIDWYAVEEPWSKSAVPYSAAPEGDCIEVARRVNGKIANGGE